MYKKFLTFALSLSAVSHAWSMTDTLSQRRNISIDEIVITGSRSETDSRRLPSTVSVIDRGIIEGSYESSLLPTLSSQVPGLFITSRGILGYGVSTGAAGGMTLRGIGNSPTSGLLVLIDGHPQYMGLMGHPIADAYQSVLAEKVEVVRGPASVLYGSNAMGHQYRYPSSNRRESYPCPDRLRVFQHVDKRSNSSIENKTFRQYGIGILQPYRRTPTRYGF